MGSMFQETHSVTINNKDTGMTTAYWIHFVVPALNCQIFRITSIKMGIKNNRENILSQNT